MAVRLAEAHDKLADHADARPETDGRGNVRPRGENVRGVHACKDRPEDVCWLFLVRGDSHARIEDAAQRDEIFCNIHGSVQDWLQQQIYLAAEVDVGLSADEAEQTEASAPELSALVPADEALALAVRKMNEVAEAATSISMNFMNDLKVENNMFEVSLKRKRE